MSGCRDPGLSIKGVMLGHAPVGHTRSMGPGPNSLFPVRVGLLGLSWLSDPWGASPPPATAVAPLRITAR